MEPGWGQRDVGWAALLVLFAASLVTVLGWLLQYARGLWLSRAGGGEDSRPTSAAEPGGSLRELGVWRSLLRLRATRTGTSEEAGVRGLLASLFAFKSFRENWQRAWVRALNEQACRDGSSIQITFEEVPQIPPRASISHVTCEDQSERTMVLHCQLSAEEVRFPVSVTQQSPAAVSMETYHISLTLPPTQLEVSLEEIPDEGLLVSWAFTDRPDLSLMVLPKQQTRERDEEETDLSTVEELIKDAIISTQPAMMINLRACSAPGGLVPSEKPPMISQAQPPIPRPTRLFLRQLRASHLGSELGGTEELCCAAELDNPMQQKWTKPMRAGPEVEWTEDLALDLGPQSRELTLKVLRSSSCGDAELLGQATLPVGSPSKPLSRRQVCPLTPGPGKLLSPAATMTAELHYEQGSPRNLGTPTSSTPRPSITPTKKIELDRTIMPDGTIVTTVTTVQSRPRIDGKLDSPSRSPSKVEVTEKMTTVLSESSGPSNASHSSSPGESHLSNGLDPVAETAIRQLTEPSGRAAKKTPTKRSTLIISGVSKVPIAQDELALSLGYAASLEASMQDDAGTSGGPSSPPSDPSATSPGPLDALSSPTSVQEADETTRSDISERPSVDDVESETGSTGALETRSLKDHKGSQATLKTPADSPQVACPFLGPQQHWISSPSSKRKAMSPPGKAPRKENLGLQCEWGSCSFVCSAMEEFFEHVTQHLQQHVRGAEEEEDPLEEEFSCLWQECGFCPLDSSVDLIRHVYFHCYHTKLKQWGLQALQSQADLSPCILDFQSRNVIPDIPDHFLCLWEHCESTFDNPEWFYRHVDAHSLCCEYQAVSKDNHVVLCGWKGCTCTFKDRCKLREHLRSHTQEKVVACPTCGGMFANNTKFLDHIRRQTALDQQRFQCSHCSKRFATERLLRDHMRNHVNHYKCPLCDMTCPLPSSLRNHIRFRHSDDRPFKCDCCDYSCKNLIDLRKHLDTHSKESAYRCDFENCSFSARSLSSIKSHHRKVHEGDSEPRYKCHVCDKCFTRGNNLTVHLRKKHQFKWPSGHPRFRYKEHEDGYMRLQLVRYESVELTQQLLQQLHEGSDPGVALNESSLQGIVLETVLGGPGPKEEVKEEEGTAISASQDNPSSAIHMVNQSVSQGQREMVYCVLSEAPGEPPPVSGLSSREMEKLQGMPKKPGVQMV